ncbi:damage-inducible protein DinB [Helicobacter aurati]|uniref:Damage-inducible protein DinB n=1 Tax=Helicobacter aurati TaxID=137778 RepID=A0A3D8IYA9_9HELI|nr:DinB family protein [Helicobacter aurati]RDU70252.1 damage-inducible protein DinB [Helicobacter aurati]
MKETILLQAKYNQHADKKMSALLQTLESELLYKDCGLYYGSIMQTAAHSLCGTIGLFLAQIDNYIEYKPTDLTEILNSMKPDFTLAESIVSDIKHFVSFQERVNTRMIEVINHIDDFNKIITLSLPNITFHKTRAHLILAVLNHATHHRGQIAGILDTYKINNDFAGMLDM